MRYTNYIFLLILTCLVACQSKVEPVDTAFQEAIKTATIRPFPLERFESSIEYFESKDSVEQYPENSVLFLGSSSIRKWKTIREDMAPIPVIKRGFGGATLPEVTHYFERLVMPHKPKIIVVYAGENDIGEGANAQDVLDDFLLFIDKKKAMLPESEMIYLAIKPSIARWEMWDMMKEANKLIGRHCQKTKDATFLDLSPSMLKSDKVTLDSTIFIEDQLHLNANGYARWTNVIKPLLEYKMALFEEVVE